MRVCTKIANSGEASTKVASMQVPNGMFDVRRPRLRTADVHLSLHLFTAPPAPPGPAPNLRLTAT